MGTHSPKLRAGTLNLYGGSSQCTNPTKTSAPSIQTPPSELSQFAFLIGNWNFNATVKISDEQSPLFKGTWRGRYILEGYAISDEYRMTDLSGKLVVLGVNLRTYDASNKTWNIKWLNALTGTWMDLAPTQLGSARSEGQSMIYAFPQPPPTENGHAYSKVTYTKISGTNFTWKGEKSSDAINWTEFMFVDCHRALGACDPPAVQRRGAPTRRYCV